MGDAFDARDLRTLGLDAEDAARVHDAAVHQNAAGTAVAVVAAFLRAGKAEILAQHLEEALARFAQEVDLLAVEGRLDPVFDA